MKTIDAIAQRVSQPKLTGDAVAPELLEQLLQCALRAPDHARLRPWRYITVEGDNRRVLGEQFLQCVEGWQSLTEERQTKFKNMLMRAPTIMFCTAKITYNPKVPREEQLMSAAAGIQSMLIAARELGLGAMWRTGDMAYNRRFMDILGLSQQEELAGILYLGTPDADDKKIPQLETADYHSQWHAPK